MICGPTDTPCVRPCALTLNSKQIHRRLEDIQNLLTELSAKDGYTVAFRKHRYSTVYERYMWICDTRNHPYVYLLLHILPFLFVLVQTPTRPTAALVPTHSSPYPPQVF